MGLILGDSMVSCFCSVLGVPLDTRMYLVFPDAIEVGTMEAGTVETTNHDARAAAHALHD